MIAKASARLYLRDTVEAFPDAMLAIYVTEETLIAKVRFELSTESV